MKTTREQILSDATGNKWGERIRAQKNVGSVFAVAWVEHVPRKKVIRASARVTIAPGSVLVGADVLSLIADIAKASLVAEGMLEKLLAKILPTIKRRTRR